MDVLEETKAKVMPLSASVAQYIADNRANPDHSIRNLVIMERLLDILQRTKSICDSPLNTPEDIAHSTARYNELARVVLSLKADFPDLPLPVLPPPH